MANLILNGSTSGSVTLSSPAVSGTTTLTLPTTSGTIALSGGAVSGTTGSFSGDLSFNSGYGSAAVAYGCRAWVNFNGTGTVAIRASGNVTSITDGGTGDYTVNFTNAMPDANYSIQAIGQRNGSGASSLVCGVQPSATYQPTSSACKIRTPNDAGTAEDAVAVFVAVFR